MTRPPRDAAIGMAAAACGWAAFLPIGIKYLAYAGLVACAVHALAASGRLRALGRDAGFRAAGCFWAFALLSAAWSSGSTVEMARQAGLYSLLLMAPLIAFGVPVAVAQRALGQVAVAAAVIGVAVVLHRFDQLPLAPLWHGSVLAEGNQRIITSLMLAVGAGIALVQMLTTPPTATVRRLAWALAAVCAVAGLALQDRRTGMVALPVLVAAIGLARQRRWSRRLVTVGVVAALSIAAWQWAPGVRGRIDEGLHELASYQPTDAADTSWGMRLRLAEHTLDMVRAHPVFGNGIGSWLNEWRARVKPGLLISIHTTPHNEYLLVAAQFGAAGLALLLWVFGGQLRRAWRAGDAGLIGLVGWCAIAWTGLFNVVLRDAKFALPLLLVAALGAALHRGTPAAAAAVPLPEGGIRPAPG